MLSTPPLDQATVEYFVRQQALERKFQICKSGVQASASHDLRISPTTVSYVIRGRIRDENVLARLEDWLTENFESWRLARVSY